MKMRWVGHLANALTSNGATLRNSYALSLPVNREGRLECQGQVAGVMTAATATQEPREKKRGG